MLRRNLAGGVLVLLLTWVVTGALAAPAAASPPRPAAAGSTSSGLLDPLWAALARLASSMSDKAGCGMDPFGCPTAPAPPAGESSEPAGRAPDLSKEGCGMDPFGCPKVSPPPGRPSAQPHRLDPTAWPNPGVR